MKCELYPSENTPKNISEVLETRSYDTLPLPNTETSSYDHLILEERLPSLNQTIYRCKEHPDKWYIGLNGLKISHFIPYHTGRQTGAIGTG
jgi:hypothetical protein